MDLGSEGTTHSIKKNFRQVVWRPHGALMFIC